MDHVSTYIKIDYLKMNAFEKVIFGLYYNPVIIYMNLPKLFLLLHDDSEQGLLYI